MGAFQYQALKQNGGYNKGVIEADSERHARQLLRDQGLIPVQIQALAPQKAANNKGKLTAADFVCLPDN